jgi:hypothetical protein
LSPGNNTARTVEIDYVPDPSKQVAPPSLSTAIGQLSQQLDFNTFDDIHIEFSRDRYNQVAFRFRAYRK